MIYFLVWIIPDLATGSPLKEVSGFLWRVPTILWALSYSYENVLGSSCPFLAPALELASSSRKPVPFLGEWYLESKILELVVLVALGCHSFWALPVGRDKKYMHYTHTSVSVSFHLCTYWQLYVHTTPDSSPNPCGSFFPSSFLACSSFLWPRES